jgi:nitrite reductase/ring-hydroxylating ferredoxin subunit
MTRLLFLLLLNGVSNLPFPVDAWVPSSSRWNSPMQLSMVRRGRGSIGKEVVGGRDDTVRYSEEESGVQWTPIPVSAQGLPTEENRVALLETNLVTLKNAQTNPTGAVSVLRYQKQIYCFSVNCPSCQVPLTKAQCLPQNAESNGQPRLVCDLCKSTYNVQTGEKLASQKENSLLGTVVRSIFAASATGPLTTYRLGERNGKLLIAGLK